MSLPEELLHTIVELIASDTIFIERQSPTLRSKYATINLRPLSMATRQLRRLCLPFLFAYVKVKDVTRLTDQCAAGSDAFSASIRTLDFGSVSMNIMEVLHLFDRFTNLSQINLDFLFPAIPILSAIRNYPAVTVNLGSTARHLAYRMRVRCLTYRTSDPHDNFGNCRFPGLSELKLRMRIPPTTLPWISELTRGHPLLKKISFTGSYLPANFKCNPTVPFIQTFVDEVYREELDQTMSIEGFAVTRFQSIASSAPFLGTSCNPWRVTGLHLSIYAWWSSARLLVLAHSMFPQISVLTLNIKVEENSTSFPGEELISSLCCFSSLQVLNLVGPYRLHDFGNQATPSPIDMEAAIIQYTSSIAQRIPTIEAFFIDLVYDNFDEEESWKLRGWLSVQTSWGIEGSHTVGPLDYTPMSEPPRSPPENHEFSRYSSVSYYI
ncbi:hypothetical protein BT96DRAFT_919549 [Gymnopus androsaceus JB14]|uniref:Uncharacterized protein n=1 Tax=Gymnopus androsaceus JB14 TaxID=1447944 RepID=A0A6A4HR93_9AGAR|nr:hypothetical protein BT96DRAFT_919549 [Gymnopus androsaceus JB14]